MPTRAPRAQPAAQTVIRAILALYLRIFHDFKVEYVPSLPKKGPFVALTSHFSVLDTAALMVADPYRPNATFVVKDSMMRNPISGPLMRWWGAIPVERAGTDSTAIRQILALIDQGRGVCIAPQGTRSRDGTLGPLNPVLMKLVTGLACKGVPVFPVVEIGTYEALPAGKVLPRPYPIRVRTGEPIDFSAWCKRKLTNDDIRDICRLVQDSLARLLPPERQPRPGTSPVQEAPIAAARRA
jgi:1-acyl-sn-glycerol-3-phosphate acyltransferase